VKIYMGKNNAFVTFERCYSNYIVTLRDSRGDVADKIRCDDYRKALEYRRAFLKIART
jgi:hypothetical protein